MADAVEHAPFVVGVLDLLHLDNLGLLQHLHSIEAVVMLRLNEMHTAEAPGAQGALQEEVLLGIFALGGAFLLLGIGRGIGRGILGRLGVRLVLPLGIGRAVYDIIDAGGMGQALVVRRCLRLGGGLHGGA